MAGRTGLRRAVVVTLLSVLGVLVTAGTAAAHSRLEGSDPVDGASLDTGPSRITLTFNEDMPPGFDQLTVTGPDGEAWQDGEVTTSGPTVSVPVAPLGPAGRYQVGYRVVSGDGHPVQGSTSFTLTRAGTGTPPPQPAASAGTGPGAGPEEGGSAPLWPWIAAAVVAVGAGVTAALRLGRR